MWKEGAPLCGAPTRTGLEGLFKNRVQVLPQSVQTKRKVPHLEGGEEMKQKMLEQFLTLDDVVGLATQHLVRVECSPESVSNYLRIAYNLGRVDAAEEMKNIRFVDTQQHKVSKKDLNKIVRRIKNGKR